MPAPLPASPDPFVVPEEASAREAIAAIGEELAVFDDWMERYQYIIELGRTLPPFPTQWADDPHRVPGCQSQVWLESAVAGDRIRFAGASDAAIVSGLVALLLRVYSGRSAREILATDPVFLTDLGRREALSTNRGNGIASRATAVQRAARAAAAAEAAD